jgi:hypothetical protein
MAFENSPDAKLGLRAAILLSWIWITALDFLAPSLTYSPCRDVVQLYSVRHSGDMARIRDIAPVICRGFVIFEEVPKASAASPLSHRPREPPSTRHETAHLAVDPEVTRHLVAGQSEICTS